MIERYPELRTLRSPFSVLNQRTIGMNLTTAFNIFVRQSLREGGIPFEIRLEQPNKETVAAMLEAERIAKDPSVKGYNDLDELFADLKR